MPRARVVERSGRRIAGMREKDSARRALVDGARIDREA